MPFDQWLDPTITVIIVIFAYAAINTLAKRFLPEKDLKALETIARIAVQSVEQISKMEHMDSKTKKRYALDLINGQLGQYGIDFNIEVILSAVEAAVLELDKLR